MKQESKDFDENLSQLHITKDVVHNVLLKAKRASDYFGTDEVEVITQGLAFGDIGQDTEIKADKILGTTILEVIEDVSSGLPTKIVIEGFDEEKRTSEDKVEITWYVDPLDASLNLVKKLEDPARLSTLGLPYSTAISVFSGESHSFSDCLTSGVIDLRSGDTWLAEKGKGAYLNLNPCRTSGAEKVDLGNGVIIGEFYYPQNRALLTKIFNDQKGYLRNPGSAAYEMALVASGHVDAFICDRQKSHELGTAYRLVTETDRGFVCDFEGNELGEREYNFDSQVPAILAATRELALDISQRIKTSQRTTNKKV